MARTTRREFIGKTGLGAAALSVAPLSVLGNPLGANEKLNVAVIGVRGRGKTHVGAYAGMRADAQVTVICDCDENVISNGMKLAQRKGNNNPEYVRDLRKVMERKDIDAVSIANQNHWHSLASIWALQAGKHVYVEKPVSHNIWEGRKLVEAQKKYGLVVQHGTQRRSQESFKQATEFVRGGTLGKVKVARGFCHRKRGSIGNKEDGEVPKGVDYDLWTGPAPLLPFNPNRFHYEWHWNFLYGCGDLGNQGPHQLDVMLWGLGRKELPLAVQSVGGRYAWDDDGNTPNSLITWYDFGDDVEGVFETKNLKAQGYGPKSLGVANQFDCEKGYVTTDRNAGAYGPDNNEIKKFSGSGDPFKDFVAAVKKDDPTAVSADALDAHLAAAMAHLGNISYRIGKEEPYPASGPFESDAANEAYDRFKTYLTNNDLNLANLKAHIGPKLTFDPKKEVFTGEHAEAANALLTRDYRKPFVVPDEV